VTPPSPCLSADTWEHFLAERLSPAEEERAAAHVEGCPRCQDQLERLTAGRPAAPDVAGPDPCPAFLRRLKEELLPPAGTDRMPPSPLPQVPGYDVLEELGRGGMGVVYRARQVTLGRLVALKMLRAGEEDQHPARLRAEAAALARLQHPNIVQVHEVGEHDGRPFLVLEYVEGGCLAQRCGKPHEPRAAAELVRTLAEATHAAHRQGVTHRDLKPGNVLLTADGTPKITDFGLAKLAAGPAGPDGSAGRPGPEALTRTGQVLGTPQYMAPEQADHRLGPVGPATDVYALGAILYELVTGRPPFDGPTALDVLSRLLSEEALPPSRLQPGLPRDLATVCLKCLHKEPRRRYASAWELAEDLRRFRAGEPIRARPAGAAERVWRWARRNPTLALLTASVSVLALATVAVSVGAAVRLSQVANVARQAERDATEKLFRSSLDQARANRFSGRAGQHYDSLRAVRQAVESGRSLGLGPDQWLEVRNEALACLTLADFQVEREWDGYPADTNGLGFDSRYARYARSHRDGTIRLLRVADDAELYRFAAAPADDLDVRVDLRFGGVEDQFLAAWYWSRPGQPLSVWELGPGGATRRLRLEEARGICDFTPDGRALVVGLPDNALGVYDLATGQQVRRLPPGLPPYQVAIRPDGRLVAVSSNQCPGVQVRDLGTGAVLQELRHEPGAHGGACNGLAWDPEGKTLAVAGMDFRIHLWDVAAGARTGTLDGHEWEVARVSFSHAGDLLASWGYDLTTRIWNVRSRRLLVSHPAYRWVGFGRDDRIAAALVEGTRVRLCGVYPGEGCHYLYGPRSYLGGIFFSPDGRLMETMHSWETETTRSWEAVFWDVAGACPLRQFSIRPCCGALFEPTGDSVLAVEPGRIRRRPLGAERAAGSWELKTGAPEDLPQGLGDFSVDSAAWWGPPGQGLVLQEGRKRVCLARLDHPGEVTTLDPDFPQVLFLGSSPDGRWVAAGAWDGSAGARVYDTRTGKRVKEWRVGDAVPVFSPDGRWLAIATGSGAPGGAACSFWHVGTWELAHTIPVSRTGSPSQMAFTSDGRLLAYQNTLTEITLFDMATFRALATLRPREPVILSGLCFSPDGGLLASSAAQDVVHLWDLRLLRRRLGEMGLDW
jgi:WD40 repeat protein/predicted Ser/Thr protein kinase